jgi:PAS domain S-box-containing protein
VTIRVWPAADSLDPPVWDLRLYISGRSPKCVRAVENLRRVCETHLPGRYRIEVIDLVENPRLAAEDQILAAPTLVRRLPPPVRKLVGELYDEDRLLIGLQLRDPSSSDFDVADGGRAGETAFHTVLAELRERLDEANETIEAIRHGRVDSLVVGSPGTEQIYALTADDSPFRLLIETINEGAATVSSEGVILYANPRFGAMLDIDAESLIGQSPLGLVKAADRPILERLLGVGAGVSARGELELSVSDESGIPVILSVSGFNLGGLFLRCLVATDLTGRRESERRLLEVNQALRNSESRLRAIFDCAPIGIAQLGLDGTFEQLNRHLCEITGYASRQLMTRRLQDITHIKDAYEDRAELERLLKGEVEIYSAEKRIITGAGEIRLAEVSQSVVRDNRGRPLHIIATIRDVTGERKVQDDLRAFANELEDRVRARTAEFERVGAERRRLTSRLVADLEREREGVAAEVHDATQVMAALQLHLGLVMQQLPQEGRNEEMKRLESTMSEAINRLMRLVFDLRPPELERGLQPALKTALDTLSAEAAVQCSLDMQLTEQPGPEVALVLYRIAQEAFQNIRLHAQASSVRVRVAALTGGYEVRIEDDGRGFELNTELQPGRLGLVSMRERAEMVGGSFHLHSTPGIGTVVGYWVPAAQSARTLQSDGSTPATSGI